MEKVYKELEEMRSAMEALTAESRAKTVLSESLRRAHDEQLARLQQARVQIEKQAKEIDAKDEEISVAKQMYEEMRSKFLEKELALKHVSLANEKLRASSVEKVAKLEGENKQLVSALDEASAMGEEKDAVIFSCKQEIQTLKGLLSASQKKCVDAEKKAHASREVMRRDEMIAKLERDKGEVEEQLKWKNERFRHLEEAHEKMQEKLRMSKRGWEMERANLVDEVSSLQTSLDSQVRVSEDLRSRLLMCNEALAREESRRTLLETQMSESKALYENVMSEYEEARLSLRSLSGRRDEEIASLRNLLATKASLAKELDFKATRLEQENEELRLSLRELREAQINGVGTAASLKTLQQKFRALEHAHRGCSEKLKAMDAEWSTQREKLSNELDDCLVKLSDADKQLHYLQAELEVSNSSLMQQILEHEEMAVVLMILKSKFLESCLILEDLKHESELYSVEAGERSRLLTEKLEKKDGDLAQAQAEIKWQHETMSSLLSKVSHFELAEQECRLMQNEINSYKVMIEEASKNLERLKQQASHRERELLEDVKKALAALDQANFAASEKSSRVSEVEFELEQSKLVVERMEKMRCELEAELNKVRDENQLFRRDLEDFSQARVKAEKDLEERKGSFLQALKQKDNKIAGLQHHLALLEEDNRKLEAKLESENSSEEVKYLQFIEDMDRRLVYTRRQVDSLKQKYVLREIEMVMKVEEEKISFQEAIEEKEEVIIDMQRKRFFSEPDFTRSVEVVDSVKEGDVQLELCALNEVLKNALAIHVLDEHEIYYRSILVTELEAEVHALQMKVESGDKISFCLKNCIRELEANLASVQLEKENDKVYFENELKTTLTSKMSLNSLAEKLESEKNALEVQAAELEEEVCTLQLKMETGEKLSLDLKNCIQELEAKFESVLLEKRREHDHFDNELASLLSGKMSLEGQVEKLEYEKKALEVQAAELKLQKQALYESIFHFSSDREELVNQIMVFGDLLGNISEKGDEVKRIWDRILEIDAYELAAATDVKVLFNCRDLDDRSLSSPSKNSAGHVPHRRSILKENNC